MDTNGNESRRHSSASVVETEDRKADKESVPVECMRLTNVFVFSSVGVCVVPLSDLLVRLFVWIRSSPIRRSLRVSGATDHMHARNGNR